MIIIDPRETLPRARASLGRTARAALLATAFAAVGSVAGDDAAKAGTVSLQRALDFAPFEAALASFDPSRRDALDALLEGSDIAALREALRSGRVSSRELVLGCLSRIRRFDGPLGSVLELAPDALEQAARRDAERAAGDDRGRLHGLPVLLKDNIATGDALHVSAGAAVLRDHRAPRDAFLVARLREAGAIILGKTNMSEWAYFMSSAAPSGYSALGGQTRNPFGAALEVAGSSTGSAVAAAVAFAAATIGTESMGSIIAPAALNGVAGMRPTPGLVSADLLVPIARSLDGAGPIARGISDLAEILTVIGARDARDPNVRLAAGAHGTDFTRGLDDRALEGLVVALPRSDHAVGDGAPLRTAIDALERAGARVVPVLVPKRALRELAGGHRALLGGGFARELAVWLEATGAPVRSLADVVAFNDEDLAARAPFGQDLLLMARDAPIAPAAHAALAARLRDIAFGAIGAMAEESGAEVLLSIDNGFSLFYATAGVPAVTVPLGRDRDGQPHGATFVGIERGGDAELLAIAHAFERATTLRETPPARPAR